MVLTMRPRCSLIFGSTNSCRWAWSRSWVPSSSTPLGANTPPRRRQGSLSGGGQGASFARRQGALTKCTLKPTAALVLSAAWTLFYALKRKAPPDGGAGVVAGRAYSRCSSRAISRIARQRRPGGIMRQRASRRDCFTGSQVARDMPLPSRPSPMTLPPSHSSRPRESPIPPPSRRQDPSHDLCTRRCGWVSPRLPNWWMPRSPSTKARMGRRQRHVGGVQVSPERVAALGRDRDAAQDRGHRRVNRGGDVGMPAGPRRHQLRLLAW